MTTLSEAGAAFALRANPTPASDAVRDKALHDLKFGTCFTDHMARVTWTHGDGWADRRVEPYAPLSLDPAAAVLHYAQEVFEGLKAYRHPDDSIWLFRPDANATRMQASAARLALPELSHDDFLGSIDALLSVDHAWVPKGDDTSLYLRPFMFASEAFLGVRPAHQVEYLLIASPVGPYFASGVAPASIWVAQGYHRAGPGGTGAAKTGGNYASSLVPQTQAYENGCQQVLFTDAATDTYIDELGGMNIFVVRADGTIETPRLSGNILDGITRHSLITLLEEDERKIVERDISLAEVREGIAGGEIAEVFACGTAAVVTPIGRLKSPTFDVEVNGGVAGEVTMGVRQAPHGHPVRPRRRPVRLDAAGSVGLGREGLRRGSRLLGRARHARRARVVGIRDVRRGSRLGRRARGFARRRGLLGGVPLSQGQPAPAAAAPGRGARRPAPRRGRGLPGRRRHDPGRRSGGVCGGRNHPGGRPGARGGGR